MFCFCPLSFRGRVLRSLGEEGSDEVERAEHRGRRRGPAGVPTLLPVELSAKAVGQLTVALLLVVCGGVRCHAEGGLPVGDITVGLVVPLVVAEANEGQAAALDHVGVRDLVANDGRSDGGRVARNVAPPHAHNHRHRTRTQRRLDHPSHNPGLMPSVLRELIHGSLPQDLLEVALTSILHELDLHHEGWDLAELDTLRVVDAAGEDHVRPDTNEVTDLESTVHRPDLRLGEAVLTHREQHSADLLVIGPSVSVLQP